MNRDVYQRIAVEIASKSSSSPVAFILTSSSPKVDNTETALQLLSAFSGLKLKAARIDIENKDMSSILDAVAEPDIPSAPPTSKKDDSGENAAQLANHIVDVLHARYDIAILSAKNLEQSDAAMLLAAACGFVVLLEEKKVSRTDEIDRTLAVIRNLGAKPLGFILQ